MREINAAGLALLKSFESCRLNSYQDQRGIWTIGWGHVDSTVVQGMTLTQDQADAYLKKDLEKFYQLDHYISEQVNDNQYSALICLAYNIGLSAIKTSGVVRAVNDHEDPSDKWLEWDHVNGVVSDGLRRRRAAELKLYRTLG